ncbi:MATE family multidrug resistance protein [Arcicella aurantiaca]|uniref:Multidrug-efflux transporter n=1 Tax=Arcicella aurantiaca TaxID=591202 RepID=A0A316EHF2_9BACT|nr:MATE family efflux transporter [Arcicella aurantiaca]PWK29227.1 MATE family multidrug resistance protein [Arcicella aurantiaca]
MKKLFQTYKSDIISTYQLALPIIAGQLGIMLMGFADTVQVGRMNRGSVQALAASADANGILINIAIIGYICLQIVSPLVSKAQAENNYTECNRLLKANILVALLMSVFCCVVVVLIGLNIDILKQPAEIKIQTQEYLWIITISTIPAFIFSAIKSFTDGLGFAKLSMNITFSALILNLILNHCFINGTWIFPEWGLNGAGVATLISRTYMMSALAFFTFKTDIFKAYFQEKVSFKGLDRIVRSILKIGVPSGLQGFSEIAAFYGAVVMMGWISIEHKAAHLVAIGYVSMTYMAATGIAAAGGIRVGASLGEKSRIGIFRAGTTALVLSLVFMGFCAIVLLIFNVEFASYVKDERVIILAAELIIWGGFFQLFDGVQAVSLGILRGIQDVNVPTLITVFAYWGVGLPMSYILGFNYDLKHVGIWIGLTLALFASASLLSWRFYNKVKRISL